MSRDGRREQADHRIGELATNDWDDRTYAAQNDAALFISGDRTIQSQAAAAACPVEPSWLNAPAVRSAQRAVW